jgi:hypothetical protein
VAQASTQPPPQLSAYPGARSTPLSRDRARLRRSGEDQAVPIAASIFLDVLNVFLFLLQLFGRD